MMNLLLVFVGGGLGSIARYGISQYFDPNHWSFPISTFVSNLISSIILGYLIGLNMNKALPLAYQLVFITGFCGGFSTFSTFSFETYELLASGRFWLALFNVLLNVLVCISSVYIGIKLGQ